MAALCSILKHGITLRASHFTLEWRINIYGEYFWNAAQLQLRSKKIHKQPETAILKERTI